MKTTYGSAISNDGEKCIRAELMTADSHETWIQRRVKVHWRQMWQNRQAMAKGDKYPPSRCWIKILLPPLVIKSVEGCHQWRKSWRMRYVRAMKSDEFRPLCQWTWHAPPFTIMNAPTTVFCVDRRHQWHLLWRLVSRHPIIDKNVKYIWPSLRPNGDFPFFSAHTVQFWRNRWSSERLANSRTLVMIWRGALPNERHTKVIGSK